jgi:hypothetical protein
LAGIPAGRTRRAKLNLSLGVRGKFRRFRTA